MSDPGEPMKFSIQLSSDFPDKAYGGDRVYQDMLSQLSLIHI